MKQLRYITCLGAFIFPLLLCAQPTVFAPVGATWRYNAWTDHLEGDRQFRYTVTGDTVLDGWNARVLMVEFLEDGVFVPDEFYTRYVSTIGDSVYYRVDGVFVLLFDFAAQPGDTVYTMADQSPGDWGCGFSTPGEKYGYIIDSIGFTKIDGNLLRVQHVTNLPGQVWGVEWYISGPIIERIGSVNAHNWFGGGLVCITKGYFPLLRCYQDSEIFYKGNIGSQSCDSIVSIISPEIIPMTVSPNPFFDQIIVKLSDSAPDDLTFTLYNLWGTPVKHHVFSTTESIIPTRDLTSGMYIWEIKNNSILIKSGKLISIRQ